MASKYRNAGQTCVCANRIYVQDKVYDSFVQKLATEVKKMKVGAGTEEGVTTDRSSTGLPSRKWRSMSRMR